MAAARPGRVAIDVVDEGPRIPSEELGRVFDKFYRGAQAGKTLGSGLGLSIARGIVELCGGSIGVESTPRGNRFTVLLPVVSST